MNGPFVSIVSDGGESERTLKTALPVALPSLVAAQIYQNPVEGTAGQEKLALNVPALLTVGLGSGESSVRFGPVQPGSLSYESSTWLPDGQLAPWRVTTVPTGP
jgi:hypothetical protein